MVQKLYNGSGNTISFLNNPAPLGYFGESAGETMLVGKIGSQIEVQLFTSKADALHWLRTKQTKNGNTTSSSGTENIS